MTTPQQYPLQVGILLEQPTLRFAFLAPYLCNGQSYTGEQEATCEDGKIRFGNQLYDELFFQSDCGTFLLHDVIIGVNFHWQRKEDQVFEGALKIIVENQRLTAVNVIGIEDYLTSVIASEMSATSLPELLKAHAIISRSWVLHPIFCQRSNTQTVHGEQTADKHIVWYERDDHQHFHVCADDHCQRYQGITRLAQSRHNVRAAIEATWGIVLKDANNDICDARFYKSCGGATEQFENAWADTPVPYLVGIADCNASSSTDSHKRAPLPDLTQEENAIRWIHSSPNAFCNTQDAHILAQVLNHYDQETADFFRWTVRYSREELSNIVRERSGIDFGTILALRPIKRGVSGRIVQLEIEGTKRTMLVGKELEIRRWLSRSHLYSSAFTITPTDDGFLLTGAGWGHGVGLCQIGAAVMASQGYNHTDILAHYFPHTHLEKI